MKNWIVYLLVFHLSVSISLWNLTVHIGNKLSNDMSKTRFMPYYSGKVMVPRLSGLRGDKTPISLGHLFINGVVNKMTITVNDSYVDDDLLLCIRPGLPAVSRFDLWSKQGKTSACTISLNIPLTNITTIVPALTDTLANLLPKNAYYFSSSIPAILELSAFACTSGYGTFCNETIPMEKDVKGERMMNFVEGNSTVALRESAQALQLFVFYVPDMPNGLASQPGYDDVAVDNAYPVRYRKAGLLPQGIAGAAKKGPLMFSLVRNTTFYVDLYRSPSKGNFSDVVPFVWDGGLLPVCTEKGKTGVNCSVDILPAPGVSFNVTESIWPFPRNATPSTNEYQIRRYFGSPFEVPISLSKGAQAYLYHAWLLSKDSNGVLQKSDASVRLAVGNGFPPTRDAYDFISDERATVSLFVTERSEKRAYFTALVDATVDASKDMTLFVWNGPDDCPPMCNVHGNCSVDLACTCHAGWTGFACGEVVKPSPTPAVSHRPLRSTTVSPAPRKGGKDHTLALVVLSLVLILSAFGVALGLYIFVPRYVRLRRGFELATGGDELDSINYANIYGSYGTSM